MVVGVGGSVGGWNESVGDVGECLGGGGGGGGDGRDGKGRLGKEKVFREERLCVACVCQTPPPLGNVGADDPRSTWRLCAHVLGSLSQGPVLLARYLSSKSPALFLFVCVCLAPSQTTLHTCQHKHRVQTLCLEM